MYHLTDVLCLLYRNIYHETLNLWSICFFSDTIVKCFQRVRYLWPKKEQRANFDAMVYDIFHLQN